MVDLVSTWITYFFPLINWFMPKKYAKISEKEFESLNIVKPVKNNVFWPVAGSSVLFGIILRKYGNFFNVQFEKKVAITVFFIMLIGILIFYFYLNKKLKLKIFNTNVVNKNRIVLIPTFKQGCLIVFVYLFFRKRFNIYFSHSFDDRVTKYNNIFNLGYNHDVFLFSEYGFDR
ncbi:DUF443 family protein [Staphylococcus aureus]|uniref:DUF443 family protein n=1 Tax=Staphylococcus aureus TaxID=1280 RepID=UPI0035C8A8AA